MMSLNEVTWSLRSHKASPNLFGTEASCCFHSHGKAYILQEEEYESNFYSIKKECLYKAFEYYTNN